MRWLKCGRSRRHSETGGVMNSTKPGGGGTKSLKDIAAGHQLESDSRNLPGMKRALPTTDPDVLTNKRGRWDDEQEDFRAAFQDLRGALVKSLPHLERLVRDMQNFQSPARHGKSTRSEIKAKLVKFNELWDKNMQNADDKFKKSFELLWTAVLKQDNFPGRTRRNEAVLVTSEHTQTMNSSITMRDVGTETVCEPDENDQPGTLATEKRRTLRKDVPSPVIADGLDDEEEVTCLTAIENFVTPTQPKIEMPDVPNPGAVAEARKRVHAPLFVPVQQAPVVLPAAADVPAVVTTSHVSTTVNAAPTSLVQSPSNMSLRQLVDHVHSFGGIPALSTSNQQPVDAIPTLPWASQTPSAVQSQGTAPPPNILKIPRAPRSTLLRSQLQQQSVANNQLNMTALKMLVHSTGVNANVSGSYAAGMATSAMRQQPHQETASHSHFHANIAQNSSRNYAVHPQAQQQQQMLMVENNAQNAASRDPRLARYQRQVAGQMAGHHPNVSQSIVHHYAQVHCVYGQPTTQQMQPHSQVQQMQPHSQVQQMQPHNQVQQMQPHNQVQQMQPHNQVQQMQPHNQVQQMQPHNQVQQMQPHSQVQQMQPHSQVQRMHAVSSQDAYVNARTVYPTTMSNSGNNTVSWHQAQPRSTSDLQVRHMSSDQTTPVPLEQQRQVLDDVQRRHMMLMQNRGGNEVTCGSQPAPADGSVNGPCAVCRIMPVDILCQTCQLLMCNNESCYAAHSISCGRPEK